MRLLFDTSILIAAFVNSHPKHHIALPWLQRAKGKEISMLITSHTLAECFSVLTRLPLSPKITPDTAFYLLRENIQKTAKIIPLTTADYQIVLKHMTELGLSGGIIFDALAIRAAKKAKAEKVLTLNMRDFARLSPEDSGWIISP